jgi:hypothetical protein
MTTLIPPLFRVHQAVQFYESLYETSPTRYYFFIGKNVPYGNSVPIKGTVKTTTTSNTIVGQGTYFSTELTVGDRLQVSGQGSNVVVVQSIPTAQTIVVSPRPRYTITNGTTAYIRKLFSDIDPPVPDNSYYNVNFELWKNMISLKKIQSSDASHVVDRINWVNNTLFKEYDDQYIPTALEVSNTYMQRYYTITDDYNVYKCIDNNRGANSVVKPTGTSTTLVTTADGYRWKYLYTITSGERLKFLTGNYMPVKQLFANDGSAQWTVQQNAANGAIHHIKIIANGSGYISTTNTFASVTNTTWMKLKSVESGVDGKYVGSGLYISEGASSGQIRKIIKYWGSNNTLIVNGAFTVTPNTTSRYVISPLVTVFGDSGATLTNHALAYVSNVYNGTIRKIKMINYGRSYSTANVVISANAGTGATARPIISPLGGHGFNPVDELNASNIMLNIKTIGSESNTFPTNNDFRQIGIVRDPKWYANGVFTNTSVIDQTTGVTVSVVSGDFTSDEVITGRTSGVKGRLVYFANSNSSRSKGVLKLIHISTTGTGGTFIPGELVIGETSTITDNVISVSNPKLRPYSGLVIYVENREPVFRDPVQTEDFKITLKY